MGICTDLERCVGVKLIATLLSILLALSMLPVSGAVLVAQNGGEAAHQVELAKAGILRIMLTAAANLNVSTELRISIDSLLRVNISALERSELKEWVSSASRLLTSIEVEIREGRAYATGTVLRRYLNGLARAVEARAKRLNLTDDEIGKITANISSARTAREAVKILERLREGVEVRNAERFAVLVVKRSAESVEEGSVELIARAHSMLEKVAGVLNTTLDRLRAANASESALEAVGRAMEKVRTAREILGNVTIKVAGAPPPIRGEQIRERVREAVNKTLSNLVERLLEEIGELREKVGELREECRNANATQLVERLEAILQQLDDAASRIVNISTVDLYTVMGEISRIKLEVRQIEKMLETSIEEIPRHLMDLDNLFNKTVRELRSLIEDVNRAVEELSKIDTSRIVCIAIYPPPPACEIARRLPEILEHARRVVLEEQNNMGRAMELYSEGRKGEAVSLLLRTKARLYSVKFQLDYVKKLLQEFIGRTPVPPTSTPIPPMPPVEINQTKVRLYVTELRIRGRTLQLQMTAENRGAVDIKVNRIILRAGEISIERSVSVIVKAGSMARIVVNIDVDINTAVELLRYHRIVVELYAGELLVASTSTNIGV